MGSKLGYVKKTNKKSNGKIKRNIIEDKKSKISIGAFLILPFLMSLIMEFLIRNDITSVFKYMIFNFGSYFMNSLLIFIFFSFFFFITSNKWIGIIVLDSALVFLSYLDRIKLLGFGTGVGVDSLWLFKEKNLAPVQNIKIEGTFWLFVIIGIIISLIVTYFIYNFKLRLFWRLILSIVLFISFFLVSLIGSAIVNGAIAENVGEEGGVLYFSTSIFTIDKVKEPSEQGVKNVLGKSTETKYNQENKGDTIVINVANLVDVTSFKSSEYAGLLKNYKNYEALGDLLSVGNEAKNKFELNDDYTFLTGFPDMFFPYGTEITGAKIPEKMVSIGSVAKYNGDETYALGLENADLNGRKTFYSKLGLDYTDCGDSMGDLLEAEKNILNKKADNKDKFIYINYNIKDYGNIGTLEYIEALKGFDAFVGKVMTDAKSRNKPVQIIVYSSNLPSNNEDVKEYKKEGVLKDDSSIGIEKFLSQGSGFYWSNYITASGSSKEKYIYSGNLMNLIAQNGGFDVPGYFAFLNNNWQKNGFQNINEEFLYQNNKYYNSSTQEYLKRYEQLKIINDSYYGKHKYLASNYYKWLGEPSK